VKQLIERASTVVDTRREGGRHRPQTLSRQRLLRSSRHLAKPWRTCQKQAIYAASRINQLRTSSSAASQLCKTNRISNLQAALACDPLSLVCSTVASDRPHWTMSATGALGSKRDDGVRTPVNAFLSNEPVVSRLVARESTE